MDQADINDYQREHGTDAVRGKLDEIKPPPGRRSNGEHKDQPDKPIKRRDRGVKYFELTKLDDIQTSSVTEYVIKGLIPKRGLVLVWGPPKCGKSFKVFTWMMYVARGEDYRGHRVNQVEVVYLALEGQQGYGRRRDAHYKYYLKPDQTVPLFNFCGVSLDLVKDHKQLIADIQAQSVKPGVIVIDTLNRSLNGSESSDEDMAAYLRAADAIQAAFDCVVIIIHHCGYDGNHPRGHSSQIGAADVQISVKKDDAGIITAEVELAKDMAEGTKILSKLEEVVLGIDQDGDDITSCVVVPADDVVDLPALPKKAAATAEQQRLLDIIRNAIIEAGVIATDTTLVPKDTRAVAREMLKRYCVTGGYLEDVISDKSRNKLNSMLNTLGGKHLIGLTDKYVWMPKLNTSS
jgi:hypothetical protein